MTSIAIISPKLWCSWDLTILFPNLSVHIFYPSFLFCPFAFFPLTSVAHSVNIGCCLLGSEAWAQSGVISEGTRPCYVCVTNIYVFTQLRFERRASTKRNLSAIWNRYPYGFKDKVKLLTDSLCLKLFQSIYVPSALLSEQMIIIPVIVLFQYFSPNQILNFLPNLKTMIKIWKVFSHNNELHISQTSYK